MHLIRLSRLGFLLIATLGMALHAWVSPFARHLQAIAFNPGTMSTITVCAVTNSNTRGGTGGWTLDGSRMTNLRSKLLDPNLFGPSGTVPYSITIVDAWPAPGSITQASLDAAGCNVFLKGFIPQTGFTAAERAEMQAWTTSGNGFLIETADSTNYDPFAEQYGHPIAGNTTNSSDYTLTGNHPAYFCPFGAPASDQVQNKWWSAWLNPSPDFTVIATHNANGQPSVVEVDGDNIIISGDVDLFTNDDFGLGGISAAAGINNTNDTLAMNLFYYAALAPGGYISSSTPDCVPPSDNEVQKRGRAIFVPDGSGGYVTNAYNSTTTLSPGMIVAYLVTATNMIGETLYDVYSPTIFTPLTTGTLPPGWTGPSPSPFAGPFPAGFGGLSTITFTPSLSPETFTVLMQVN